MIRPIPPFDGTAAFLLVVMAIAETALGWLLANVVMVPLSEGGQGMPMAAVAVLVLPAWLLPPLLQWLGWWHTAFTVVIIAAVAFTTGIAIWLTSFPGTSVWSTSWLADMQNALILEGAQPVVPVWSVVIVAAMAWWRGHTRGNVDLDMAMSLLRFGAPLALAGAAGQAIVRSGGDRSVTLAVLLFFSAALTAIALTRPGRTDAPLMARVLTVILPVGFILLLALLFSAIVSRDMLDTVVWLLTPLIWILTVVFRVVVLVTAVLSLIIVYPLVWLLSLLPLQSEQATIEPESFTGGDTVQRTVDRAASLPDPVRYLIAAMVLFVLFSGVTRLAVRFRGRKVVPGEERESVLASGDLLTSLKALLRRPFGLRGMADDPLAALRGDPVWASTVTIREIYTAFLRFSGAAGIPRACGATPAEHAAEVLRHHDGLEPALPDLIQTYQIARYGDRPASQDQAAAAREAWERIRTSIAVSERR